jgi:hypothetical protein
MSYLKFRKAFKKNLLIVLFTSLIFSISCTDKDEYSDKAFKNLEPVSLNIHKSKLLVPSGFDYTESGLLTIESKLDSNQFKIFASGENEQILSFGKSGSGPGEFSGMIQQPVSTTLKSNSQFYDWSKKRLSVYDLSLLKDGMVQRSIEKEYVLPPELMLAQYSAFINDSTVVSSGGLDKGYISFTDVNTDESNYFDPIDFDLSSYDYREKSYLYESFFGVNNKEELIAVASKFMPEMHIINYDGEIIAKKEMSSPNNIDLNKLKDIENMKIHFYGLSVSEEYIFATYVGKSVTEMDEIIKNNEFQNVDLLKLYKFDWQGNLIESYQLTGGLFPYLSIDDVNSRLYSMNSISDSTEIVYFNL